MTQPIDKQTPFCGKVPDGYWLAPNEPTDDMAVAALNNMEPLSFWDEWQAIRKAAPKPPPCNNHDRLTRIAEAAQGLRNALGEQAKDLWL